MRDFTPRRSLRNRIAKGFQATAQFVLPRVKWLFPRKLTRGLKADFCIIIREAPRVVWIASLLVLGEFAVDFFKLEGLSAYIVRSVEIVLIAGIVLRWL